jgi:hypothetical protein
LIYDVMLSRLVDYQPLSITQNNRFENIDFSGGVVYGNFAHFLYE